jgi:membrane associated rhomboid family serine protease
MIDEFEGAAPGRRERAINAPVVVVGLIAVLIGSHALRVWSGTSIEPFAVTDRDLRRGVYAPLVTCLFVHGSWAHVLLNAVFILAFGAPVARRLGEGLRGAIVFLVFFLVCGVLATLTYADLAAGVARVSGAAPPFWALIGASGAASGLMGGAVRLMGPRGRLGPLISPTVLTMTAAWIVTNLVLGVSGLTPGAGGAAVAWQAHITGYFAGLLLISPFARLAGHDALGSSADSP